MLARDARGALQLPAGSRHPLTPRAPERRDTMAGEAQCTPRAWAGPALASMLARLGLAGRQDSLTAGTCEAGSAKAAEAPPWVLQAVPGVSRVAGARATLVDIGLAAQASVAWGAGTAEAAHQVHTGAIVQAPGTWVLGWAWATVVLINLTENPERPRRTGAEESGHQVNAEAPMLAGPRGTLIHVSLTVVTSVASWTLAHIAPHVALASAPVLAGPGRAGVRLLLAVAACAARRAHAVVGALLVHTLPPSLAQLLRPHPHLGRSLSAGQALDVTEAAAPPRGTEAVERGPRLGTATPVLTRLKAAPVYQGLTLSASEALWTGADEARVGGRADAPVQTGPGEAGVGLLLAVRASVARAA